MRLNDFPKLQAELVKSMYNQIKGRCNDGVWRDFKAEIKVNGKPYNFECRFKLDNFFLTLAKREIRDGNRIILPAKGNIQ
jgi:hypothetical protein